MLDFSKIREIEDSKERYETALELFNQTRRDAGKTAEQTLMENAFDLTEAAERLNMTGDELRRQLRDGSVLEPLTIVLLADRLLNESCHRFLFGMDGITELPQTESVLTDALLEGTEVEREAISTLVDELFGYDDANNLLADPLNLPDVVRARILALCVDRQIEPSKLLGINEHHLCRISLKKVALQKAPPCEPQLNFLMYLAIMLNTSIDYFLTLDYVVHTAVRRFAAPEKDVIKDKDAIYTVGQFLHLSPQSREKVLASLRKRP